MEGTENVRSGNEATSKENDEIRDEESMEDDSENESSSSEEDDKSHVLYEKKIQELQQQISENPFLYDAHIEVIKLLQKSGELDELREAREKMSQAFPLTEDLWLDWVRDEIKILSEDNERIKIEKLFERAVKDYLSVPVWLEYVQFAIGGMGKADGVGTIREVFERALTAVGLHTAKGANIWEAYREFENAILAGLLPQAGCVVSKAQEKEFDTQHERVVSLFKRQLTVPLIDMKETLQEYLEWLQEDTADRSVKLAYDKALNKLQKLQPCEDALLSAESPRLEQYQTYIDLELAQGDPPRIQCIFERALAENCLNSDMWSQYTDYLDTKLKVKTLVLPVFQRAIRNCPWMAQLWQKYILAQERHGEPHESIKATVDIALTAGLSQSSDYQQVWTTYCDYLRRRINWNGEHQEELSLFRNTIENAVDHLLENFGAEGDQGGNLRNYWAVIECKFCGNITKARELWNQIMTEGHGKEANLWLQYYRLERCYGDNKHCRKLLQRALNSATDWPQAIVEAYIHFERVEGDLEQYDQAVCKCNAQMQRINERITKAADKEAVQQSQKKHIKADKKVERKFDRGEQIQTQQQAKPKQPQKEPKHEPPDAMTLETHTSTKRKLDQENHQEKTEKIFKVPPPPGFKGHRTVDGPPPGFKGHRTVDGPPPGFKDDGATDEPPAKRLCAELSHGENIIHDSSKNNRTVFVSNLDFTLEEERIGQIFSKCGEMMDVRLVRNYRGKSKGYGFVEFKNELAVESALLKDRELVDGRPMYVSHCEDRSHSKAQFKFNTGIEKNKLFIKNLPFTCTKEALEKIFGEYGQLKDVRIVTYKSGAPKGLAFVEYENEPSAVQAVLKTDGLQIGEHSIAVAISNPPVRKTPFNLREELTPSLGGGKKETELRGKSRTMVALLPRSVSSAPKASMIGTQTTNQGQGDQSETANSKSEDKLKPGMSNQDFRKFLLNK